MLKNKIGNPMAKNPRFARPRSCQNKNRPIAGLNGKPLVFV